MSTCGEAQRQCGVKGGGGEGGGEGMERDEEPGQIVLSVADGECEIHEGPVSHGL